MLCAGYVRENIKERNHFYTWSSFYLSKSVTAYKNGLKLFWKIYWVIYMCNLFYFLTASIYP